MRRVAVLLVMVAAVAAACGGGGTSPAQQQAKVTTTWETFFNSKTPEAQSETFLQNGSALGTQITALRKLMPADLTASVSSVTVTGTSAKVSYMLMSQGKSLLGPYASNGTAVEVGGKWFVSQTTFCGLATLAGSPCPA